MRILKESNDKRYYLVKIGFDTGDAESGPINHMYEIIVKARSEKEAEYRIDNKYADDLDYVGCSASIATNKDIEQFKDEIKKSNEEYEYLIENGLIDPEFIIDDNKKDFSKMSLGELKNEYEYFYSQYYNNGGFKQFVRDARNNRIK